MRFRLVWPDSFFITVVYGAKIWSSMFMPPPDAPLRRHHAEHAEDLVADADLQVGRIDALAEQRVGDVGAEHADLGRAA